ncbi:hypothetical protein F1737_01285 [Methanoplanus sp. FWC-SCC4]|uniref:Type I restriction modification DNA specificity domain-containing protein n=1 Tax=Methanochimaera problematica TaxID=2609417 RepID=A0AA97FA71_9EURY|nr:restriction endonuclease subunit S [Methanoplanus sp. FWC-SCC4]WOF15412.1 hypothetical protein F1737_01285 [Methanoplanus sp. FWC-SCC4]
MSDNWESVKFETLYSEPSKNGLTRPKKVRGQGYKMVNMGEIFAYNIIKNPSMELVPLNDKEKSQFSLIDGDLLFARQSLVAEGAGKCSIVLRPSETITFESHLIRVRLNKKESDPSYYFYYFISPQGKGNVQSLVIQVAAAGIRGSELAKLKVPKPPLPTQKKIAAVLSAYDDLIENNNRRIKILEEMAQALYREWFVEFRFPGHEDVKMVDAGDGRMVPEGWECTTLKKVIVLFDRLRKPLSKMERENRKGTYPYYGAAKIFDYIDDYIFDGDFLLMAEDGSVITTDGKPMLQLAHGKFWANNHTHIIQGKEPISLEYLYLTLSILSIIGYVTGAAQPKITQTNLNRIPILYPEISILESFNAITRDIFSRMHSLEKINKNLTQTRDLLLPRLIEGEVEVSDLDIAIAKNGRQ